MPITLTCVTTADAGTLLGVDRTTAWRYIQRGVLQGLSTTRGTVVPLHEVANVKGVTLAEAMQLVQNYRITMWNLWVEGVS